ncbi:pentatricopeptide repeat protein [Apiospora phragmitis]|uniref:Pentatricopeptide repeat protein n=1 Tax=Apiospora phragmitis TaxID=2905665 RepID=A0ABR1TNY5_9PEZI
MFTCRACTRRLLAAVADNALSAEPASNAMRPSMISTSTHQTRSYAAATSYRKASLTKKRKQNLTAEAEYEAEELEPATSRQANIQAKKDAKAVVFSVKKHLDFLQNPDPFHIADRVRYFLQSDRYEEAKLMVVSVSKKKKKVHVGWNHLIEYQMKKQRPRAALKLFAEMRKLGQLPTVYTYTILFRGFALSDHKELAVAEAVKIYNNMLKGDRIKPNTQHYNALLQVCARAGDLDTMFTIVQSSNDRDRTPDNFTYTTILNALRAKVEVDPRHQGRKSSTSGTSKEGRELEQEQATKQTVIRAKAIWEEVLAKWRSASLVIDEQLVYEEALIKMAREAHLAPPESDIREIPFEMALQRSPASPTHAKPGNNALSAVLQAIQQTTKTSLVPRYWDVFTRQFGVNPDTNNWHALLRALRYGHNSAKVAEYLWIMPRDFMSAPTFRIAMNACLRDKLNRNAFHHGSQVLEVMLTSLRTPDAHVMRIYLQLAHAVKRPFEDMAMKDTAAAKLAFGKQLVTALENLWEPYRMATKQFSFGGLTPRTPSGPGPFAPARATDAGAAAADTAASSDSTTTATTATTATTTSDVGLQMWKLHAMARGEISALARKMIAAYDRLIFGDLATADTIDKLKPRRNQINAFVVKYFEDREKYEPGWNLRGSFRALQMEGRKKKGEKRGEEKGWEDDEDDHEFLGTSSTGLFKATATGK